MSHRRHVSDWPVKVRTSRKIPRILLPRRRLQKLTLSAPPERRELKPANQWRQATPTMLWYQKAPPTFHPKHYQTGMRCRPKKLTSFRITTTSSTLIVSDRKTLFPSVCSDKIATLVLGLLFRRADASL